ncbi:hypothetical protein JO387_08090 [Streptococcus suis]|uniref:hypothetical protein n=2 Tax=Streptococcus suis TaxID=1307 RepID=UPI000769103A|nr:hypothetical protein [Streptococcus suis]MBM7313331.1 hypothetical protein [Streptococcus suis]CYX37400.1 Uncharacterised protein [Streptococcus suis]HEL1765697.1 hypothetical protein [Streptococcus suis]
MLLFMKLMMISACIFLGLLTLWADHRTFKESLGDKIWWFILDVYALGLLAIAGYMILN